MKRFFAAFLTLMLFLTSVTTFAMETEEETPVGNFESFYLKTVVEAMAQDYKFGISKGEIYDAVIDYVLSEHPELLEGSLKAAAGSMDEHTMYMPKEELGSFLNYVENEYIGIGVTVVRGDGAVKVEEVASGGAAYEAGIKVGDLFIKVDGEDVTSLGVQELSQKVRGPVDTTVELVLRRNGEDITITVKRRPIKVSSVSYHTDIEKNVGYMYIQSFTSTTPKDVAEALTSFKYQDVKNIIVDVRDNPGGEFGSVLDVLSMFVPKNKLLVTAENSRGKKTEFYSESNTSLLKHNIVVLVNENTASAAELFAGAVRDNKAGTVIGVRTYGKGSIQSMMGLRNPVGHNIGDIKITTGEYFLPSGDAVHQIGVKPNVIVKNEIVKINDGSFSEFLFDSGYKAGDESAGVFAIEERLSALGLDVGEPDEVFDEKTKEAVKLFQKAEGLYPKGEMDITTQNYLNNVFNEAEKLIDHQLDAAYSFFETNGK